MIVMKRHVKLRLGIESDRREKIRVADFTRVKEKKNQIPNLKSIQRLLFESVFDTPKCKKADPCNMSSLDNTCNNVCFIYIWVSRHKI